MEVYSPLIPRFGPEINDPRVWPEENSVYMVKNREWLNQAYQEAATDQKESEELTDVEKYIDYLKGNQWPKKRATNKPSPVNNRIERLFWELVGQLTDIRPIIEVKSNQPSDKENQKQAQILNLAIHNWWLDRDIDLQLGLAIIYAILTTGFVKQQYNPAIRDMEWITIGPKDLLMIRPRHTLQSSQGVIYKCALPLTEIRRRFPYRGHLVQPDESLSRYEVSDGIPGNVPEMVFNRLTPAGKRLLGYEPRVVQSVAPMAMYREFWVKDDAINPLDKMVWMGDKPSNWGYWVSPGNRLYPRGRLMIMGGRHILHDGPNPYWHGEFPFGMLRLNIVPWQIYGLSELRSQVRLQDIINMILAGVLQMVTKAVNPAFFAPKNAFSETAWDSIDFSLPNARAAYNISSPHEPKFVPQPNLPGFVMNLYQDVKREMNEGSGIATMMEAMKKKQVPSGDSLEQAKQAHQTPVRLKGRNIEVFLRDMGKQQVFNIFQFYDAKKRFTMLGKEGITSADLDWDPYTMIPADAMPEEHAKQFSFTIQPGSLLSFQRLEEQQQIIRLRLAGEIDRRTMFKALNIPLDVDEVEKNLLKERTENQGALGPMPVKGGKKK